MPLSRGQTNTCETITLPQTLFAGGNNFNCYLRPNNAPISFVIQPMLLNIKIVNFYRPQHSCCNVMFLHLSVILSTGGCLAFLLKPWQTTPWADTPPPRQTHPPRADTPQRRPLQRMVCILLECTLFLIILFILQINEQHFADGRQHTEKDIWPISQRSSN